jgi:hypothetical protein
VFVWSKDELAVGDGVRSFVGKEVRPLQDELWHGDLPPYDQIRRFLATFGLDAMAGESFDRAIAVAEVVEAGQELPEGSGGGVDPPSR